MTTEPRDRRQLRIRALLVKPRCNEPLAVILANKPCYCGLPLDPKEDCQVEMSAESMNRPQLPGAREGVW